MQDPRALARILEQAEARLASIGHPDPVIREFRSIVAHSHPCSIGAQHRRYPVAQNGSLFPFFRLFAPTYWIRRERNLPVCTMTSDISVSDLNLAQHGAVVRPRGSGTPLNVVNHMTVAWNILSLTYRLSLLLSFCHELYTRRRQRY